MEDRDIDRVFWRVVGWIVVILLAIALVKSVAILIRSM